MKIIWWWLLYCYNSRLSPIQTVGIQQEVNQPYHQKTILIIVRHIITLQTIFVENHRFRLLKYE